jgi:site-specific DNA recombinase
MEWDGGQRRTEEAMYAGRRQKVERGIFLGNGPAPYGYIKAGQRNSTRLEVVPEQANVVRRIFAWFVHDQMSMAAIKRRLEELHIPPPGNPHYRGRKAAAANWGNRTVSQILRHEVYAGTFYANRYQRSGATSSTQRPREAWIPITVPAIVDRAVWVAAQERSQKAGRRAPGTHPFLMRKRLRCACGYALSSITATNGMGQVYLYYECGQRHRSYTQCRMLNIRADKLDAVVWEWVCGTVRHSLPANVDVAVQRRVVEELNLAGTLGHEDERRVLYLDWSGTTTKLWIDDVKGASTHPLSI